VDVAFNLSALVAYKLIVFTFGSLIHLFLMVLILGQRRMGRLEWSVFALMAALFMWNAGNLLALNVALFYGFGQPVLSGIARVITAVGLMLSAPALVLAHQEYARLRRKLIRAEWLASAALATSLLFLPWVLWALLTGLRTQPLIAVRHGVPLIAAWLSLALIVAAIYNRHFARDAASMSLGRMHRWMAGWQTGLAAGIMVVFFFGPLPLEGLGAVRATSLMLASLAPSLILGYAIFRHKFLALRLQPNLVVAIVSIFALVLYLAAIHRLSVFLEAREILPSTATETVMIFILVVFLEPVKKQMDRFLHRAFVSEFETVQKLSGEIQDIARQTGDLVALRKFVEDKLATELHLGFVELRLAGVGTKSPLPAEARSFPIRRGGEQLGTLNVIASAPDTSGEQFGAIEILAEQLAAAIELCRLIAAKVELERELERKARLAYLGEMAARIAHNVKNPLSSMKTVVQLLEEDSTLPDRVRGDCRMIAAEIDRLNRNITQVLRYAKPARDTDRPVDLAEAVRRILDWANVEAEGRGVRIEFTPPTSPVGASGGEEAAADIVSNLVVNALEATPASKCVRIRVIEEDEAGRVALEIEDQGRGIPADVKEEIFEPFFTTRPGGTGLGLAIVARRVEEIGGSIDCLSPVGPEGGTRFTVRWPSPRSAGRELPAAISRSE
jgi:signal transduction histidine kinase